jgi:hypothetical protein
MPDFDDDRDVYSSAMNRSTRRRRQKVAGVAGLAAVLGVGAYFITSEITAKDEIAPEPAAIAPLMTAVTPSPVDTPSASLSAQPSAAKTSPQSTASASKAASPHPMTTQQRIDAAKGTAAKAKNRALRPLPQVGNIAEVADVTVRNTGSLKDGGTMRVVSGRGDLTGQRELGLVADAGEKVGDASCTQNFHFAAGLPAVEKPTMMICWRTSDDKSVFTVAVSVKGRPSADNSVAAIDRQWAKLN